MSGDQKATSDAYNGDIDLPGMGGPAMLENKDSLPAAQGHPSRGNGNHLARSRKGHSQMACGIVRAFEGVHVVAIFRGDLFEVGMEVRPGARVCVLIDDQTGAGMAYENGHSARSHAALPNDLGHFIGDFVCSLAPGRRQ